MIFIALVVAVAAGIGFWLATSSDSSVVSEVGGAPSIAVQETSIIVARRDIPVGHRITEDDLDQQTWPQSLVLPDFVIAGDQAQLIDQVARTAFRERQPIALSFLANPNDPGFLAAQIPAGKRAVTIPVDDVSGLSGFIFPGDRIDILIKHRVGLNQDYDHLGSPPSNTDPNSRATPPTSAIPLPLASSYEVPVLLSPGKLEAQPIISVTEVLVPNARVLAVGQFSAQYQQTGGTPNTITVEVAELDAQKLRHADQGMLTVALRSLDDASDTNVPRPIGDSDLSRLVPPSYFPHVYGDGDYETNMVSVGEVDYNAAASKETEEAEEGETINVIRGVTKEIVGVNRQ